MKNRAAIAVFFISAATVVICLTYYNLRIKPESSIRNAEEVRLATQFLLGSPSIPLNISRDGTRLLMQSQDATGYGLFLVDNATQATLTTISTGARPRLTTWSPDGRFVSFSSDQGGAAYQLFLWDLSARKLLLPKVPTTRIVTQPKWSKSSHFLTHVTEHKGKPRPLSRVSAEDGALPIPVAENMTPKASMAWAPDESALATVLAQTPHVLTVIPFTGAERHIPSEPEAEIRDMDYAPDGKSILLTVRRKSDEHFRLSEADLTKGEIRILPSPPVAGDVVSPFFLPEGQGVVYRVYPGNEKLIFACNREGKECRRLGPTSGQPTPWAASPDGRTLFVGQQEPKAVYRVDIATGNMTEIYRDPPPEGVGPDGGRISVPSFDGLEIPVHFRRGKTVSGMEGTLWVQILGGIGKESPTPWDRKAEYLYQRGISALKIYVRGKAGFGRRWQDAPGGTQGRVKDIVSVLDHAVRKLHFPQNRIVLFGHSDGAMLAAKAAAADAAIGALVISSMVPDPEPTPPTKRRCVVAFQGSKDSLPPERARVEIEKVLGPNTTREPCGRLQAIEGEAHELEKAESWAEVFAAIVTALKSTP